jgi:alpha/beta superfamily hydrolase
VQDERKKLMPEVIINGPDGRLECRYMPSEVPDAPTALILHPEPDKGGTMNNRVTYALYKHFQARGFAVLRFNFRGVGRSQGEYDNGEGELSDAATAMDWLQAQNPASRPMLDCRIFFRRMDWHAIDDASPRNSRFYFGNAASIDP